MAKNVKKIQEKFLQFSPGYFIAYHVASVGVPPIANC